MGNNILNIGAGFKCNAAIGVSKFNIADVNICLINNMPIATQRAQLIPIIISMCRNQPNPSGGFLPCNPQLGSWLKLDRNITYKNNGILTSESYKICGFGGVIKIDKLTVKTSVIKG